MSPPTHLLRPCARYNLEWAADAPVADYWPVFQSRYERLAERSVELIELWESGFHPPKVDSLVESFWWASIPLMPSALSDFALGMASEETYFDTDFGSYANQHRLFVMWLSDVKYSERKGVVDEYKRWGRRFTPSSHVGIILKHDLVWSAVVLRRYARNLTGSSLWYARALPQTFRILARLMAYPHLVNEAVVAFVQSDIEFWRKVNDLGPHGDRTQQMVSDFLDTAEAEIEEKRQSLSSAPTRSRM